MTDRDVRELLGHMVMEMRQAEMLIEALRAEVESLKAAPKKKNASKASVG